MVARVTVPIVLTVLLARPTNIITSHSKLELNAGLAEMSGVFESSLGVDKFATIFSPLIT